MAWGLVQLPGQRSRVLGLRQGGLLHRQGEPRAPVRLPARRVRGPARRHRGGRGGDAGRSGSRGASWSSTSGPPSKGAVRAELLDADGSPLAGFARVGGPGAARGRRGRDGDVGRGGDVGTLAGQAVRLRLVLKDADVFSFRFEE